ncbi:hypothetical protein AWH48_07820 [Domibacillus aminovorans]|uniref:Haloacid dehalogenase n=1 Tax=Domibacillus aminovorans TaxID=29332 RepID=A0A177KMZ1_9BACI|nr:HAD-IA family hydrolase [Domibacillus aminovorans]OAH54497.1 hypothetical protein AWH48_07820 [Domibacillus aminovorans]
MVRAIIFDLDDTLISEKKYIESGYQHISKLLSSRFNKDEHELYQLLIRLFNESSRNVFNRLLDKLEIIYTKDTIMELVEEYRSHLPAIELFDDVLPCLEFLKKKGIKLGIITDGYANAQRQKLDAVGAYNYFDKIIVTDELGREYWKPHPRAFEMIKETLNVEFEEIIYVGDNPKKDFYISSIYPIKTIRVSRENGVYNLTDYYENIKEDINIRSLNEMIEVLNI